VTIPTPLEIAAALFILANVWLATKENIWTWPTGIAGVILYAIVNYKAGLYANAALQIVYFVLSIIGWYEWLHGGENKSELHVRRTTKRQWIGCAIASVVLWVALYALLRWTHNAQQLLIDSGTTALSLVGQWMMNEKLLENWWFWLIVDIAYVPMYLNSGNWLTAGLYAVFCILCIKGIVDWKRSLIASAASA
jgi:nicotinamide mononucleotide transporter